MEQWRDIKGYEGTYQVSNLGNVKTLERTIRYLHEANRSEQTRVIKERKLKGTIDLDTNYRIFSLRKNKKGKTRRAHQLVAEAFLGHVPNGLELVVDHINDDPLDNRAVNLQMLGNKENMDKGKRKKQLERNLNT